MKIKFSKMHGLGNDFVVIDAVHQPIDMTSALARQLADRRFGVGCDQVLVVERSSRPEVDFRYRIFNADGSEVEQCGNGARCFVRFVHEKALTPLREIRVETRAGTITLSLNNDGLVTVDMGEPIFDAARIPFVPDVPESRPGVYPLEVGAEKVQMTVLSMGNPHAVQVVEDVDLAPVLTQGELIVQHTSFPAQVNAGFMQVIDSHTIRLRVFERGAGETLACGTGACAAVVAGIERGLLQSPVRVHARGGDLVVEWAGRGCSVKMTGPAVTVFEGEITLC